MAKRIVSLLFLLNDLFYSIIPPLLVFFKRFTAILFICLSPLQNNKLVPVKRLRSHLVVEDETVGASFALFLLSLTVKLAALLLQMEKWKAVVCKVVRDVREQFQIEFLRVLLTCESFFLKKRDVEFVFLELVPEHEPLEERCGGEYPQETLLVGIGCFLFVRLEEVLVFVILVVVIGVNQQCSPKRLAVLMLKADLRRLLLQLIIVTEQRCEKPEECFPDFINIAFGENKLCLSRFFELYLSRLFRLKP